MVIATDQITNDEVVELSPPESSTSPILLNKNQTDEYDDEDDLECDTDEEMHLHNPAAAALDTTGGSSMNNEQLKEADEEDEVDEDEGGSLHSDMSASKTQSGNPKSESNNSNYVYVNRKELRKLQLSIHQIQSQQTLQMNLIEQIQLQLNSCIKTQNEYKTIAEQHMSLLGKEQQPAPLNPKLTLASETLLKNTTNSIKNLNNINNKLLAKQQAVPVNAGATSSTEQATTITTATTTSNFNELNNYKSKKLMAAASLHNKKKELENFEYHQKQQQQQQQQQDFENNDESEPNMSDDYEDYEEVDFQKSAKRFKPNKPAPQQQVII